MRAWVWNRNLRQALARNELELPLQPIVDSRMGKSGCGRSPCWPLAANTPSAAMVGPDTFNIQVAEQSRADSGILYLGAGTRCEQMVAWQG